jgi:hypothetical protein
MIAEREGMQSARQGTSYGPHAETGHDIDQVTERRAAKSPMRRKRREIPTTVAPRAPQTRYGAGF